MEEKNTNQTSESIENINEEYNGLLKYIEIDEEEYKNLLENSKNDKIEGSFDDLRKSGLPSIENVSYIKKTINVIFPPQKISINGRDLIPVKVSESDEDEDSIKNLCEDLQKKLDERQARRKGICDIRAEIYEEAFKEIIRQITINCPERGMLLMRVNNEMKITIASYKHLYDSSVSFGIRKHIQAETGVKEMKDRIKELKFKRDILENQKKDLSDELKSIEMNYDEINKFEEDRMMAEIEFLQNQNKTLNEFLQGAMENGDSFSTKRFLKNN